VSRDSLRDLLNEVMSVTTEHGNLTLATNSPVSEVERLRLHNLLLQQQLCRHQLQLMTIRLLQTPEVMALQRRIDEMTAQINAIAERLFLERDLDPNRFQFNVDSGVFVERS
jgi:hypothetical protein